ncbi:MAG: hypothetical protein R2712_23820 [Vicinamibacterales bacterium]
MSQAGKTLLAAVLALSMTGIGPRVRDGEPGDPDVPFCEPESTVQVSLRSDDLPLVGTTIAIDGSRTKLSVRTPRQGQPASCTVTLVNVFREGHFSWSLRSRPAGSRAALAGTNGSRPRLEPDMAGTYTVRLTACPGGCRPEVTGSVPAEEARRDLVLSIVDEFVYPPATEPIRPGQPPSGLGDFGDVDGKCGIADDTGTADILGPAWVTVNTWSGPDDYELLEGVVRRATTSRRDNPLNHHSQDFTLHVAPDPALRGLMPDGQGGEVEVEWEIDELPERARPSRGDRVSAVGFFIHDCDHGGKTEIHPPVLIAAHRPRPVALPPSAGRGTNVVVPGIVTELWVSQGGGEATDNCSATGLHQSTGPRGCLPRDAGFIDGNPIQRRYQFRIYLPKDPQRILREAGRAVPPVPLFTSVENPDGSAGPEPQLRLDPNREFVDVSLDLTSFRGRTYGRRIRAAWAYAAPDNWALHAWRLEVPAIDVHNDADGPTRGDGDWKFWINVNNGAAEWTKVFDCEGCVHGRETFNGRGLATGRNGAGSLGPDLRLYPRQRLSLFADGFETDWVYTDSTGTASVVKVPAPGEFSVRSHCSRSGPSGCGEYTLEYRLVDLGPVGNAALSAAARQLYDAYAIRPAGRPLPGLPPIGDLPVSEDLVLADQIARVGLADTTLVE